MDSNSGVAITDFFQLFHFDTVFLSLVSLAVLYALTALIRKAAQTLGVSFPTSRLAILQAATVINFIVYAFGLFAIVALVLRPPKALLLALGGSVAVAVGFALKDFVASVVAGLVLIFDRPFQVGDRVSFDSFYGDIELIGLRAVRLRTLNDDLVTIPNNKFLTEAVASGNAGALDMLVCCSVHLDLEADLETAQRLLREVVVTSRYVYLKKPVALDLVEVTLNQSIVFKLTVKAFVLDVRYQKAFETDMLVRATKSFREHEVLRPGHAVPSTERDTIQAMAPGEKRT